jgi:ubiquinol-cytochrome c reductase cytochrome c1 subunit
MKKLLVSIMLCCCASPLWAAEAMLENIQVDTSLPAIERGMDDLMSNCHSCHSLKFITYHDLARLGIDRKKIDAMRGDQPMDAPLTGVMSDEAAMQSFGKVPPDLSLMTKAREGGPSYVYSYLLGYYNTPEGVASNHIFPETKMPDVLGISYATDPAQRAELQGKARGIVSFLAWAADPHEQERHRLGYYVIGYLVILTFLLYLVKNQIWSRLK